ncbi:MAG: methyltransferase domain-containing protein [Pseudomonadota bacterium]
MSGREMSGSANKYPIKTTADEYTRLAIQSDLFRQDAREMLALIGNGRGQRVLDLCCGTGGITDVLSEWVGPNGTVLGGDLDAAKLEYARQWAQQLGLSNVSYEEANAFQSGLPAQSFDLVHARFALSVIQDGLGILDHMLTLVKPGGYVCVQEVNATSMECDPPNDDWDRAAQLCRDTFARVGANVSMGASLRRKFLERGLRDPTMKLCVHAQTSTDPMTMHVPLTLAAMRETITSQGLMEGNELDTLITRVADHLARSDTTSVTFTMVQVVGRAP